MNEYIPQKCVICESTEDNIPLVSIKYRGDNKGACITCLPTLIHGKKNIDDYI
ncbi:MAG: hypothetical protein ACXADA_16845 [Candidatus Hodarchaeales archaeon]|jgi:hypothetical protein